MKRSLQCNFHSVTAFWVVEQMNKGIGGKSARRYLEGFLKEFMQKERHAFQASTVSDQMPMFSLSSWTASLLMILLLVDFFFLRKINPFKIKSEYVKVCWGGKCSHERLSQHSQHTTRKFLPKLLSSCCQNKDWIICLIWLAKYFERSQPVCNSFYIYFAFSTPSSAPAFFCVCAKDSVKRKNWIFSTVLSSCFFLQGTNKGYLKES